MSYTTRVISEAANNKWKFNEFTQDQYRINVNELVNAELYVRLSAMSAKSIDYLKKHYTPQEVRRILLGADPMKYTSGKFVTGECTAPRKENRGIDYNISGKKYYCGSTLYAVVGAE